MFNSDDFRQRKPAVLDFFEKKGYDLGEVSMYCTLMGIPLTVVYEFIAEERPELEEACKKEINRLNEFYGVRK